MKNSETEEEIVNSFEKYQVSRNEQDVEGKRKIMQELSARNEKLTTEDIDPRINKVYQKYQEQRDPYRSEVIRTIMDAARSNLEKPAEEKSVATVNQDIKQKLKGKGLLSRFFHAPGNFLDFFAKSNKASDRKNTLRGWSLALPALGVMTVAFTLVMRGELERPISDALTTVVDLPAELIQHAPDLGDTLEQTQSFSFGFSRSENLQARSFNLGVVTIDLLISSYHGNPDLIKSSIVRLQRLLDEKTLVTLSHQFNKFENITEGIDSEASVLYASELIGKIKPQIDDQNAGIYQFGLWTEKALLASQISLDKSDSKLFKQQLESLPNLRVIEEDSLPEITAKLVSRMMSIKEINNISPSVIREGQEILKNIKATMNL